MSLRARVAVTTAAAVAVAVLLASAGVYLAARATLYGDVDDDLRQLATAERSRPEVLEALARAIDRGRVPRLPGDGPLGGPRAGRFGGAGGFVQLVPASGQPVALPGVQERLPVDDGTVAVARGEADPFFETVEVDDHLLRIYTTPMATNLAAQVARPVDDVVEALRHLRRQLTVVSLLGVGLAALLGAIVAQRAVGPVRRLTESAEHVAATQDLSHRIEADGEDELGRLARTFNTMLANLEQARRAQHQLVADASHELRTPLTSLRTNIDVLASGVELDPVDRRNLLEDVAAQLDEFGRLVTGLVELARGDQPVQRPEDVRLDELVETVAERTRRNAPHADLRIQAVPAVVRGERDRLERAVTNLLDNAVKYAGDAGPIEVDVGPGGLSVRDHGPGVAAADLEHVFDRFYRAPEARGAPGSGLGLSIVAQVVHAHGGEVQADLPDGGGLRVRISLPGAVRGEPSAVTTPTADRTP